MNVSDALTSKAAVRMVLAASLVMAIMAGFAYAVARLRATYRIEQEIAVIQSEMTEIGTRLHALDRDIQIRLSVLERMVYASGPPQPQVFDLPASEPAIELWQKNRDRELRERLRRLEAWRLEHQAEPKEN